MSILDNYIKLKIKSGTIKECDKKLSEIDLTVNRCLDFKLTSLCFMKLDREETSTLLSLTELNQSHLFITYLHQEMHFSSLKLFLKNNHKLKKRLPNLFIKSIFG